MTFYLGVDGGGTRCRMRLCDDNLQTLAEQVVNAPSNLQVRAGSAAYSAINELTEIVFEQAGLGDSDREQTHACFGMAGARLRAHRESFAARRFPFASVQVFDDIDIAQAGAHDGGEGAVLIIGTGSAGMGIIDGKRHQIGGWGFLVGDTMSGGILGRELIRYSLLAHEELEPASDLTRAVMEHFNNDADTLMGWSFDNPDARAEMEELAEAGLLSKPAGLVNARPADYGSFVPLWFDYLEKKDPVAEQLLQFELRAIDQYVNFFKDRGAKSVAIVGGLGQRLMPHLEARFGDLVVMPKHEPLHGAVLLARRHAQNI